MADNPVSLRLLDLFCCEGGAATGYSRAGFDVTGIDLEPQPRYPFEFIQDDALAYVREHGHEYDAIHASPPCQAYSALSHLTTKEHPRLIEETRAALRATGRPYIIENVPGAPLESPTLLCGSMFGLDVRRHRHFESNFIILAPNCQHGVQRERKFLVRESKGRVARSSALVSVAGNDTHVRRAVVPVYGNGGGKGGIELWREVMEMPWASRHGLAQAIPPVYTEMLGAQLAAQCARPVAA